MDRLSLTKEFSCNQVSKYMNEFMEHKLSSLQGYRFVKHCEHCQECMEELKLIVLMDEFLRDSDEDDLEFSAECEIEEKFIKIKKKIYILDILDKNVKYFVVGATIFVLLSLILNSLI